MSLINQMLRDLESRQSGSAKGRDALSGLRSAAAVTAERPGPRRLWLTLGVLAATGLAAGLSTMQWPLPPAPPEQASIASEPPLIQTKPDSTVAEPVTHVAQAMPPVATPTEAASSSRPLVGAEHQATSGESMASATPPAPEPARSAIPDSQPVTTAAAPPTEMPQAAPAPAIAQNQPPSTAPLRSPAPETEPPRAATRVRSEPTSPARASQQLYQQGLVALERNERRTAETRFHEALDRSPTLSPARVELARLLIAERRSDEAARLLDDGLELTPDHSGLTQLRARLLIDGSDLDSAVALLRTAPPVLDDMPEHHALLAAVEQRRGRDDLAVGIYRQLVALRPGSGQWQMGLAISLERLGEHVPAAGAYARALDDPRLTAALRDYAQQRLIALRS